AHRSNVSKHRFAIAKCPVAPFLWRARSREHFVPGGKTGFFAIDRNAQVLIVAGSKGAHWVASNDAEQVFIERNLCALRFVLGFSQPFGPLAKKSGLIGWRLLGSFINQVSSHQQFQVNILLGSYPL